ncbi:MAG: rhomboid family intramembrane serine protease, partial [Bacteroidota bacterium]
SLWAVGSSNFAPYQYFTYMFAHGDFGHIIFNMLGLIFLGPMLEYTWGNKKFLTFYIVTGVGAGILFSGIEYYKDVNVRKDVEQYISAPTPDNFNLLLSEYGNDVGLENREMLYNFLDAYSKDENNDGYVERSKSFAQEIYGLLGSGGIMLGASGAVYGILMAFGLMFPNRELMLLIPPIPVKAKYLVLVLGGFALYSGFQRDSGGVAHFAHLGGMIFAFIMIKYWQYTGKLY